MNPPDLAAVDRLTVSAGFGPAERLIPLPGGANNRVYRVETARGSAVVKTYFRHADDPRDRLGAEFAFAQFAWSAGIRCIPEPLASDPASGVGLFAFVDGRRPAAEEISRARVNEAGRFIRELNSQRWRPRAGLLPLASEGCFSLAEHLATVSRRVERLMEVTDPAAAEFIRHELRPAWQVIRARCEQDAIDNGLSLGMTLAPHSRFVSPSDFGFHNALQTSEGRVRFLDFEYAGWDDPAKLVCDFFCQPAVPVPDRYLDVFTSALTGTVADAGSFTSRVRVLMSVYRLKWVCIRLNDFLPIGTRRRAYALSPKGLESRKSRQLEGARTALQSCRRIAA